MDLLQRIKSGEARVGIIGLGYVGLPLAVEFAKAGLHVIGYDVDQSKIDSLSAGKSYIPDVPSEELAAVVKAGTFRATTDQRELANVDIIDICVPTPLRKTRDPDLSYVVKAIEATAAVLRKGQLVILESTTYPGTTEEIAQPALEEGGLKVGRDFYLAFSPGARRSRQSDVPDKEHPEGRRRDRQGEHRACRCVVRACGRSRDLGRQHSSGGNGQAAREHVSRGEHRPRERDRVDVPSDEYRCLAGHRRGRNQTVRLHAVLSRSRTRRPLHSHRSVLFVVEGAAERL